MLMKKVLLIGLESSGKTSLVHKLKGLEHVAINVRGSTKTYDKHQLESYEILDTPGFRLGDQLVIHEILPKYLLEADEIWLVARGPELTESMKAFDEIVARYELQHLKFRLFITFKDKGETIKFDERLPVEYLDLTKEVPTLQNEPIEYKALKLVKTPPTKAVTYPNLLKQVIALMLIGILFVVPVYFSYKISQFLVPLYDEHILAHLHFNNDTLSTLLVGHYGLLSICIFSIIWALPVVILLTLTTELYNEIGIKDWITDALDPLMQKIGLTGADLLPVITGFGCNVVALEETKSCFVCTKKTCISVIAFGSACSYQLGATLSVLSANHHFHLLLPYILLLSIGTIMHAKLFQQKIKVPRLTPRQVYLKWPKLSTILKRSWPSLHMFFAQALPIFFIVCIVASVLEVFSILNMLNHLVSPILAVIGLKAAFAPAILASIIRKDGILLLNSEAMHTSHYDDISILIALMICSTLTPCLVTMLKIKQLLGTKEAAKILMKQATTSLLLVVLLLSLRSLLHIFL